MRRFYAAYPKWQAVSAKLSWSHYVQLISVEDELARSFYEKQCIKENWSIRELNRQKDSMLFERIALSKDKKGALEIAHFGWFRSPDLNFKNPAPAPSCAELCPTPGPNGSQIEPKANWPKSSAIACYIKS